jgi:tRNA pseudouridine38-40 synthase
MRFAVKFAYDGRKFYGYARQPNLKTVEGDIIKLLIEKGFIKDPKESHFRSASRTDKGVSALGNVIAFNTDSTTYNIIKKMNCDLIDILFYGIKKIDYDFFPRYAKLRHYRYYLRRKYIKIDKILSVSAIFTGEHNFSNFARVEEFKDPWRIINNIIVTANNDFFVIDFYAQTFLWHQIRRIISAIEKVAIGKLEEEKIIEALNNPDKIADFGLASADPLILKDILYDFSFGSDKYYLKILNCFEERIVNSLIL